MRAGLCLCVCVCVNREPCKNGGSDQDVIWEADLRGPKEELSVSLDEVHIGASWRIRLNDPCSTPMLQQLVYFATVFVSRVAYKRKRPYR